MGKQRQLGFIALSVISVAILFFAFDTVTDKDEFSEMSGSLDIETAELESIVENAESNLSTDKAVYVRTLRNVIQGSADSAKLEAMEQLSAFWFDEQQYAAAGYWAKMIADQLQDESSWGIAGSTFAYGVAAHSEKDLKESCLKNAEVCFENAISLNPDNIDYRINLAICYVELPPENNPMRGIQGLLRLNQEHPENTSVLYHLARFGLRTGQVDKAVERLETATELDPQQKRLYCLLAEAYRQQGNVDGEERSRRICEEG